VFGITPILGRIYPLVRLYYCPTLMCCLDREVPS
jgi:hypothetical protein